MGKEINRFLDLDNKCPIDDTGEYHQLAIQLARWYCKDVEMEQEADENMRDL